MNAADPTSPLDPSTDAAAASISNSEPAAARRPRVAIVFGGRSTEHAISCVTAGSVMAAIDPDRYEVVPIGITREGRWVLESADPERLSIKGPQQLPSVAEDAEPVSLVPAGDAARLSVQEPGHTPRELGEVDVVFPVLHGPWGEDGTIQGMLEMAGVRYVGAGVLASAVGMDKAFMKVILAAAGLPVMPGFTVTAAQWRREAEQVRRRGAELGYPLFVKPARGGSSIGIAKVRDPGQLDAAIEGALAHDPKVLVETSAEGAREVECGVMQSPDGGVETTLPAEIRITGEHEFYDFAAKYLPEEATELDVPADLPEDVTERIRSAAARAFEAIGGEGLSRVDFFLLPDGGLVVNEINTMPGFTPLSMFPRMWAASGVDYPTLVDRLIRLALGRGTGLR